MISSFNVTWTFYNQFPGKIFDDEIKHKMSQLHNLSYDMKLFEARGDAGTINEFLRYYTYSRNSKQLIPINVSIFIINPRQFSQLSTELQEILPILTTFSYPYLYDQLTTSPFTGCPETVNRCLKIMSYLCEKEDKKKRLPNFSGFPGAIDVNFAYKWNDW